MVQKNKKADSGATDIKKLLQKSVTKDDVAQVLNGGVLQIVVPWHRSEDSSAMTPQPPAYWTRGRDAILRSSLFKEAMWSAAIGIAITRIVSLSWEIKGSVPQRVQDTQELLRGADGRRVGWVGFLSKQLRDYLTTDNGSFIEIVRASPAEGSKIIGLRHLDSLRCIRTGDPDVPVVFQDRRGAYHEMRDHQVMMFSEMPDPSEIYNGVGLCAASRAFPAIYKLSAIEWYLREKISGMHPLAIYIVNGVLDTQLREAVLATKSGETAKGVMSYMGAVVLGVPDEMQPNLVKIPLAELPDRFQRKEEFDIALLTYADVLGLDPQELQPLSSGTIGTGAQSQVLADKARGKGLVAWREAFTHAMNEYVMPMDTEFAFVEKDYRDIQQSEDISTKRAQSAQVRLSAGLTTPDEERTMMIEKDELPKDFADSKAPGVQTGAPVGAPGEVSMSPDDNASPEVTPGTPTVATNTAAPAVKPNPADFNKMLRQQMLGKLVATAKPKATKAVRTKPAPKPKVNSLGAKRDKPIPVVTPKEQKRAESILAKSMGAARKLYSSVTKFARRGR